MWTIRFVLLGVLAASTCGDPYLFRHRRQLEKLLENGIFNITFVTVCHCLCFLCVGLPPAGGWRLRPDWLEYQSVRVGFPAIGVLLICAGAFLAFATLRHLSRKGRQVAVLLVFLGLFFGCPLVCGTVSLFFQALAGLFQ